VQNIAPDTVIDGRYRVDRRLGSGGMADVYCATDLQLGRKVAVKLLYRRFAEDEEFVERFRREASSAAGLQHPNVVAVYDRGEWDGTSYIAMEYLDGRSLKDIVRDEGPLPPARATELILQVLKAARFAHRRGIIHRDFKPHNVLVDDEGRAKVTDFGIARAGASDMTETGSIMGTAQYLSPEQAQGHAVSAQSDLYSIGIMLYELLTGRVPFDGDSPVTIALKQVGEEPTPPRALNPAVPPALEAVVLRALQKDPAQRFGDADAFITALEQARGGGVHDGRTTALSTGSYPAGVSVPPPAVVDPVEELERQDRRNLRRIALWTFVALMLAAIAVGGYLLLRPDLIKVPDAVNKSQVIATTVLQNDGFKVDVQRARSDTVPADRVFRQDPAPGEEAEAGSTVVIIVSEGPGDATIPAVAGETVREARRRLEGAGFKADVRRQISDSVAKGRVIETTPPERSRLQKGRTVELVVSSGPEQVRVPNVVGRSRDEAESTLQAAGFDVTIAEQESEDQEAGTVLAQSPDADSEVDAGSAVRLTVAKAPPPVAVPDVEGQDADEARAALRAAGFAVRRRMETVETPDDAGKVLSQDPPGGEERQRGDTVTLTIGDFEAPDTEPTPTPTPDDGSQTGGAGPGDESDGTQP
jgi:serine/threonine-protein kinase